MKNFPTKANISAGDDSGSAVKFGANEFNSLADENKTAVISTGQTLTTGTAADTTTDQLARGLVIAGQSAASYTDSGAANAYVLTKAVSTLVQPEAYFDGMRVIFSTANANTGASTVNVSGLGVKSIRFIGDTAIDTGTIITTKFYELTYISSYSGGSGAFVISAQWKTATTAEVVAGTSTDTFVTPAGLYNFDGAWQAPTLVNGWAQTITPLRFRLIQSGKYLRITGSITGASATAIEAFVLPAGYIPSPISGTLFASVIFSGGTTDGPAVLGLDSAGSVTLRLQSDINTHPTSTVGVNMTIEIDIPT